MKKEERMASFHDDCFNSIINKTGIKEVGPHLYYFDNSYSEPIAAYFKGMGFESKELEFKNGSPFLPICSLTSSGRLCFLYFISKQNGYKHLFEQSYPILKKNGGVLAQAHPDAVFEDIYYECKCQEIVNGEGERMKSSYLTNAKYFEEFFNDIGKITDNGSFLEFDLSNLGIDLEGSYFSTQINVKQLLCHLLALANRHELTGRQQTLQYIIFVPNKATLSSEIYSSLDLEINKIFDSNNNLKRFAKTNGITFEKPIKITIGEVENAILK